MKKGKLLATLVWQRINGYGKFGSTVPAMADAGEGCYTFGRSFR